MQNKKNRNAKNDAQEEKCIFCKDGNAKSGENTNKKSEGKEENANSGREEMVKRNAK